MTNSRQAVLVAAGSIGVNSSFRQLAAQLRAPFLSLRVADGGVCFELRGQSDINVAFITAKVPEMTGAEAVGGGRAPEIVFRRRFRRRIALAVSPNIPSIDLQNAAQDRVSAR